MSTSASVAERGESGDDGVDVVGALREHQAGAAVVDSGVHVGADLVGASFVVDERGEDRLDVNPRSSSLDLGRCGVHDQLPSDQFASLRQHRV